ncbi:ankyrin repeat and MYND domain-containing protein 1-like [Styela clava]
MRYSEDENNSLPRLSTSVQDANSFDKEIYPHSKKDFINDKHGSFVWISGATYIGEVSNGRRCGKGRQTWPNGSIYEGGFLNDMRHGNGRHVWCSGEEYEGEFYKDHRHGEGVYRWPDGSEYCGTFYLGRKEGYGKFIFSNGDIFEGLYKKDERCGPGIFSYKKSNKEDIGLWYKEKLIRLCSEVEDIFSIKDHPEYPYFPDEHFSQIVMKENDEYMSKTPDEEKSFWFSGKEMQARLQLDENYLPDGIEHYSRDFEHLPVTSNLKESLQKAFFKDNYHLVKNDENAFIFARNNTTQLIDVQRQMYRHRHVAEKFSTSLSSIDGAQRDLFGSRQGQLEVMSENLIKASTSGDGKTVYKILKSGLVNPNVCDNAGNTPLLGAAINCHSKIVNLLLDMGANIDHVNDEGITALNACHVFYYPTDHFRPNIAERYIDEHMTEKPILKLQLHPTKKDRMGSTPSPKGKNNMTKGGMLSPKSSRLHSPLLYDDRRRSSMFRRGSVSPATSRQSSLSRASDSQELEKKNAVECCKSDLRIKARFREISSAKHEARKHKQNDEKPDGVSNKDDADSVCSTNSILTTSADSSLASKKNLVDFYLNIPEDLIERTATLLSMNRRAVSGISTRDGQAISLGTAGALAVWKAEHEELRRMIELLLQRGASANKSAVPMPPLFFAVKAGDTDAIRLLLLRGASTETRISSSFGGFTPLHIASALPGKEGVIAVKLLLQAGANPNVTAHDDDIPHSKNTVASESCLSSDYSVPTKKDSSPQWLSEGLKFVDEGGRTPLHIACDRDNDYKNACEVVHELLDNGADPDVIWSGHSPLSLAISSGNDCAIEELINFEADASMPLKRGVGNALCAAANTEYESRRDADSRIKLVDKLVNAGANMLAPIVFGTKQVTGTVVDYAHWMFGKDSRIAHTPYHALSYHERDTYNARKRLLAHFGNLLREAAVKVERDKLKQETKFGVRSLSPSREERFLYTGAGAKSEAALPSSPQQYHTDPVSASHVSFPTPISPEDRPDSKISSTIFSQPDKQVKPVKKSIKGRSGSGPIRKPLFRYCYECGRSVGVRLTTCSRCREVYYCSRSCKLKAWEERHKAECLRIKNKREQSSPSANEIASYFTIHTLKEAIENDPTSNSMKILPKNIVTNTEFMPRSKSGRTTSSHLKFGKTKGKPRKKTASSRSTSVLQPSTGKSLLPSRRAHVGEILQSKVGKAVYFGTTGMTLAELGIKENYSFE